MLALQLTFFKTILCKCFNDSSICGKTKVIVCISMVNVLKSGNIRKGQTIVVVVLLKGYHNL